MTATGKNCMNHNVECNVKWKLDCNVELLTLFWDSQSTMYCQWNMATIIWLTMQRKYK